MFTTISALLLFLIFLRFFRRAQALDYDIKAGLKNDEFELHYQPIVDIETGACHGSEALIRWRHPDEGVLLPGLFIPSAEKTGLINPIGDWILRQAVRDQSRLIDKYELGYISINLSPIQLNSGSFDSTLEWLAKAPVTHEKVLIEVTEKSLIRQSHTTAMDTLSRLHKLGCGVALDDFGAGYSSFNYLKRLPVHYLKIDGSFIEHLSASALDQVIVRSIADVARAMGKLTIAEFVEDDATLAVLREIGIDFAQGFGIGPPRPTIHEHAPEGDAGGTDRRADARRS